MEEDKFEEFEKEKKSLKVKYIFLMLIVAIISAVAASEFTLYYYTKDGLINKGELSTDKTKNINAITQTLKSFRSVIDEYYIGEIDEQKMLDETIKGYVNFSSISLSRL